MYSQKEAKVNRPSSDLINTVYVWSFRGWAARNKQVASYYTCVLACVCTYLQVYLSVCVHIYIGILACAYAHIYRCTCMCVCTDIHMYLPVRVHISTGVLASGYVHIYRLFACVCMNMHAKKKSHTGSELSMIKGYLFRGRFTPQFVHSPLHGWGTGTKSSNQKR